MQQVPGDALRKTAPAVVAAHNHGAQQGVRRGLLQAASGDQFGALEDTANALQLIGAIVVGQVIRGQQSPQLFKIGLPYFDNSSVGHGGRDRVSITIQGLDTNAMHLTVNRVEFGDLGDRIDHLLLAYSLRQHNDGGAGDAGFGLFL